MNSKNKQPIDEIEPRDSSDKNGSSKRILPSEVFVVFGLVTLALSVLYHAGSHVPWINRNLGGIAAVLFIYGAAWRIWKNERELSDFGITLRPVSKNLIWGLCASAIVLSIFLGFYIGYYTLVCGKDISLLGTLGRDCRGFAGGITEVKIILPPAFWELILAELLVVSLPEEVFFRGYVQGSLNELWKGRRRILGVDLGWAWVVQAALFGLGHFFVDFNPLRLAVAIPALAFGYLREATGSIAAPVIFHASCNIFMIVVDNSFFPPIELL